MNPEPANASDSSTTTLRNLPAVNQTSAMHIAENACPLEPTMRRPQRTPTVLHRWPLVSRRAGSRTCRRRTAKSVGGGDNARRPTTEFGRGVEATLHSRPRGRYADAAGVRFDRQHERHAEHIPGAYAPPASRA